MRYLLKCKSFLDFSAEFLFYQEEKIVTVSPYWVVVQRGNTYLIGYNHNENKIWHFRVDKMKDVEMTSDYAKHKNDTELKGISEIIIAKQRNGPIGTVKLAWLAQYTKFGNLERQKMDS